MKHKKLDIKCYSCGHWYNSEELAKVGAIEIVDGIVMAWCDRCSNSTYICNLKGAKSQIIDIDVLQRIINELDK